MNRQTVPVPGSGWHSKSSHLSALHTVHSSRFARQSRLLQIMEGLATIVLIGLTDYQTRCGLDLSPLYLLPVLWISYHTDKSTGLLLALSSVVTGCATNKALAHPSVPLAFHYSNSVIQFILFLVVVDLLSYLRGTLKGVQRLANTDALTGLLNPRCFRQRTELERQRAERYGRFLTVVYLDLDCFKQFNDSRGHQAGDTLLRTVAEILRQSTRAQDLVARLGGDEFGLLLTEADYETAHGCLQRLHERLLRGAQEYGWQVTVSLGVVTYTQAFPKVTRMLEQADQFLYDVKRNGKNRLEHRLIAGTPRTAGCNAGY